MRAAEAINVAVSLAGMSCERCGHPLREAEINALRIVARLARGEKLPRYSLQTADGAEDLSWGAVKRDIIGLAWHWHEHNRYSRPRYADIQIYDHRNEIVIFGFKDGRSFKGQRP